MLRYATFHLFTQWPGQSEAEVYNREVSAMLAADELGYDTVWIAEHHFRTYGIVPNVMQVLTYVAGRTKNVRLASGIVILPFHNPLKAAEEAAVVDLLSQGRLTYGFGRGYHGAEFAGFRLSMDDTRERADEILEIMRKAWAGETFSHKGEFYDIPELKIIPKPLQNPVPLVVAAISESSVAHYARMGIPVLLDSTVTTSELRHLIGVWKTTAAAHGHDPDAGQHVVMRLVNLTDSNEEAKEMAMRGVKVNYAGQSSKVYDPFLAYKDAPSAQERFALDSAPIDPVTGKVAKGYEYWEKGYLGRGPAAFDPGTEESWEERWAAGDARRVNEKLDELEEMGIAEVICTFAAVNAQDGESYPQAVRRTMADWSDKIMAPRRQQVGARL